jgi:hypothetical protein
MNTVCQLLDVLIWNSPCGRVRVRAAYVSFRSTQLLLDNAAPASVLTHSRFTHNQVHNWNLCKLAAKFGLFSTNQHCQVLLSPCNVTLCWTEAQAH